jgi:E3 ubiquitin-protein ligase HUWE1
MMLIAEREMDSNQKFRQLVTLHIRITLLSEVFSTTGYQHGRAAINLLQMLMGESASGIVSDLGALHRVSIWQNIVLKAGLSSKGIDVTPTPSSPLDGSPDHVDLPLPEADAATPNGVQPETSIALTSVSAKPESPKRDGPREHNAKALKHLTNGLPNALSPLFQGGIIKSDSSMTYTDIALAIVKMFYSRRNPDPPQKKQIVDSANTVADVILSHITQKPIGKFQFYKHGKDYFITYQRTSCRVMRIIASCLAYSPS